MTEQTNQAIERLQAAIRWWADAGELDDLAEMDLTMCLRQLVESIDNNQQEETP